MIDRLLSFIKHLVPPSDSNDTKRVTHWRWGIFIGFLILAVDGMSGRGLIWSIGAYAASDDVAQVNQNVNIILELQYAAVIRDLHNQICKSDNGSKPTLQTTLDEYQRRYRAITGSRYPLPVCPQ